MAGTLKPARDINADGFAEIARSHQLLVHPRWFFGLGQKTNADFGVTLSQNQVRAGDFSAIKEGEASAGHPFFQKENVRRLTLNGQISTAVFSKKATWTLRGAGSAFQRGGDYAGLNFSGRQMNTYLETNLLWKTSQNDWVVGTNLTGENFQLLHNTPAVSFNSFSYLTEGLFAQFDHRFSDKVALQTGLRADHHGQFGWFVLPRVSCLFKPVPAFSARLGYGRGYKTPDLFGALEPTDFGRLQPLAAIVRPDLANSLNADLNFQKLLFDAVTLQVNQAFYFVSLAQPFEWVGDSLGRIALQNFLGKGRVLGTDTCIFNCITKR